MGWHMNDKEIEYTGVLSYRDIDFTFVCDGRKLKLIPPKEKAHVVEWEWGTKPLGNGVFTLADPIPVGEEVLFGMCNETKCKIAFLPEGGSFLSISNAVVIIPLFAYAVYKGNYKEYDRLSFSCSELNYIHPINKAFTLSLPQGEGNNGVFTVSTLDFETTTTERQSFLVDNNEVTVYFGISRAVGMDNQGMPLRLESTLVFEFEPTDDFSFATRLWSIARDFVRYLCYRRDISINEVKMSAPYGDGKHDTFALLYFAAESNQSDQVSLKKGRYIKQSFISGSEGKILSDIAAEALYIRHLPDSYHGGKHINAARFVMITAAFEWEFRRLYPDGVKKPPATIEAEEAVGAHMQECVEKATGRQKKIYKFLQKLVKSDSLQTEIIQIGNDFSEMIDVFGKHLYRLNGQTLVYADMGQRLAGQRNNFAHGNLDKEFIGLSLLDLIYMELIVYAMQLHYYGIEPKKIQKAINDLFCLRLAID